MPAGSSSVGFGAHGRLVALAGIDGDAPAGRSRSPSPSSASLGGAAKLEVPANGDETGLLEGRRELNVLQWGHTYSESVAPRTDLVQFILGH